MHFKNSDDLSVPIYITIETDKSSEKIDIIASNTVISMYQAILSNKIYELINLISLNSQWQLQHML